MFSGKKKSDCNKLPKNIFLVVELLSLMKLLALNHALMCLKSSNLWITITDMKYL